MISYLGLEDDRLDAPRPNTSDEIKRFDDFDIQRSGLNETFLDEHYFYSIEQIHFYHRPMPRVVVIHLIHLLKHQ